jgi:hypothetical protein
MIMFGYRHSSKHREITRGNTNYSRKDSCKSVLYTTKEMQLIQCSLLLSALYMFRAGVDGLDLQFQPIHTSGRHQESMTIPKAAHTVL